MPPYFFHQIRQTAFTFIALLALVACSDSDSGRRPQAPEEPTVAVSYDSTANPPELPFPNAAYRGEDGRLALPLPADADPDDLGNAVVAVNTLDGFSTIAPLSVDFAETIDATSIEAGSNVRVFEISVDREGLPDSVIAELETEVDYRVSISAVKDSRLLIKPLQPLTGGSHYLLGISSGIAAESGLAMGPSADYLALRDGDTADSGNTIDRSYLSSLIRAQEALLSESGMELSSIATSLSFPTQSISTILDWINDTATARSISLSRPTMTIGGEELPLTSQPITPLAAAFGLTPSGQVDIYTGTIELPYYMQEPDNPMDDSVYDSFLRDSAGRPILEPAMGLQSNPVRVPILVTIPNTSLDSSLTKPADGWPVAIYQHGFGGNRTNMLLIADALAAQGVAGIAIDQPVHGVIPADAGALPLNVFAAAGVIFYQQNTERHFDLDLDADGTTDLSGQNFFSPRNQLTLRDNFRQAASDLFYLSRTIPTISLNDEQAPAFNPERIHLLSLSFGSVVGTLVAGVNTDVKAFSLSAPGGGFTKWFEGSPNSNASRVEALAQLGFEQGTQDYEDYLTLLTTIEGPADPINYARAAGELHPIHITEIIGDGTLENLPDQTIPNDVLNRGAYEGLVVETAPLAGTEPIARLMDLRPLLSDTSDTDGLRVIGRFVRGDHQSQVNPVPDSEVTAEIQVQTATFLGSDGTSIQVNDSTLLEMNYLPPD